jgi:plasmid stabilization system protein ParE
MEKKIVVTKRFRKNTQNIYHYILKEFSANVAFNFLDKIEDRVNLIFTHPTIGKPSAKKENIRSILLTPHNQIFYRFKNNIIELLCIFDMRKNPLKKPY